MLVAGGDEGVELPVLTGLKVGGDVETAVRVQAIGSLTGVGIDPLKHGQQLHRITDLIAHLDRHDHLVVTIVGGLGVVVLHPAFSALKDETARAADVPQCMGFVVADSIGGKRGMRHRQRIKLGSVGTVSTGGQVQPQPQPSRSPASGRHRPASAHHSCPLAALFVTTCLGCIGMPFCRLGLLLALMPLASRC